MLPSSRFLLKISLLILLIAICINGFIKWSWSQHGIIDTPLPEYDYIIIGGGTAGCVLARRLWEKTNYSILVIEPGSTPSWISSIPLLAPALQGYADDWAFKTVSQEKAQYGMENRQSSWPRGKVLGGSSILNYMVHMWGSKSDFDQQWNSLGPEWNFDSVLPYYKKAENFHGTSVPG